MMPTGRTSSRGSVSQNGRDSPCNSPCSGNGSVAKSVCLAGCRTSVLPSQKALLCDFCDLWCHLECDDRVSAKLYAEMHRSQSDAVLYVCKTCRNTNFKSSAAATKLAHNEDTLLEIKTMVANIEKKVNHQEQTIASFDEKILGVQTNSFAEVVKSTQQINEIAKRVENTVNKQEVQNRKVNAIVFNVKEDHSDSVETLMNGLLDELSLDKTFQSAMRLGGKPQDSSKYNRPIKVSFPSEEDKWTFLRRLNSIKPGGVFGKLDLTQEERKTERALVDKLKAIRQQSQEKTFKIKNWEVVEVLDQGKLKTVFKFSTPILDQ